MSLFDLPNELLYQIISNVESEIDLSSLLQGYSDLEAMILPRLHQLIAEKYEHLHLEHCAAHRMAECMRYSLKINEGFGSTHPYSVGNALCCAAMIGRNDMVQMLIDNGADINDTSSSVLSALNYAIERNQLETVRLLAAHGADLNLRMKSWSNETQFPLWQAVMGFRHKMAGLLLELGAETDAWFHYSRISRTAVIVTCHSGTALWKLKSKSLGPRLTEIVLKALIGRMRHYPSSIPEVQALIWISSHMCMLQQFQSKNHHRSTGLLIQTYPCWDGRSPVTPHTSPCLPQRLESNVDKCDEMNELVRAFCSHLPPLPNQEAIIVHDLRG